MSVTLRNAILVAIVLLAVTIASPVGAAVQGPVAHDIQPGGGVTEVRLLSHYHSALTGTPGDTLVYVLQGKQPGGTAVVVGGTHANEIGGIMAAVLLVENATVERGTLFVIPHANNSAITATDATRPGPKYVAFASKSGERRFLYGARLTHVDHQHPDPTPYMHPSGMQMGSDDARNLNRVHPGRSNGTLTEQISFALRHLIESESAVVAIDLHEAIPGSRLANIVVSHPKGIGLAAGALVDLDFDGISLSLEPSNPENRGLSHFEWGERTDVYSFLTETPNPGQWPGGRTEVVNDPDYPLWHRVAVQLAAVNALIRSYVEFAVHPQPIIVRNIPSLDGLATAGIEGYLQ